MSESRAAVASLSTALLAAAITIANPGNAPLTITPVLAQTQTQLQNLTQANANLQAGEADKALALLQVLPGGGPGLAQGHNLICRVRLTLEQWDGAATECRMAVHLDPENSAYHLWLGRALGEKAARASFLTAYSLAKQTRAEFEESVHLDDRNVEALSDLGDFYRQAPGVVGGGIDKAQGIVLQLEKVDPARAHQLRGRIAEQQKDYPGAEREFKQAIAAAAHPALEWTTLAGFYGRRQRFSEMESAMRGVLSAALRDKQAAVALYDGAGMLTEFNRDPALAAAMLEGYLASTSKTEEAPAFIAHIRLARLKATLGDTEAANRERAAAVAMAREYSPTHDPRPIDTTHQKAEAQQESKF